MPTDRPPPKSSLRRAPSGPAKIPTGPPLKKFAPYIAGGAAIVVLAFLIRTPRYTAVGGFAIGVILFLLMGYVAVSYRISLNPDDRLRAALPVVAFATVLAAIVPFGYTIFPPPARGEVALTDRGEAKTVAITGTSPGIWITVRGSFVPNATGLANYFLSVRKDNGPPERIDGSLRPHAGGPLPERHVLHLAGPGAFQVRLEEISEGVARPLYVSLHAKPFSTLLLALIFTALGAAIVAIDVMLWRRGLEPSYAAALLLPLVAVVWFQREPISEELQNQLLRAGIVGALGGGLGGELVARLARMVFGKG